MAGLVDHRLVETGNRYGVVEYYLGHLVERLIDRLDTPGADEERKDDEGCPGPEDLAAGELERLFAQALGFI